MEEYNRNDKRFWLGMLFVIVGAAWLLDNLNVMPWYIEEYLISWQSFLILLGGYLIVGRKKMEPGIVLIAIGGFFLLEDMNWFDLRDMWHIFWPAVIIIFGISLILRRTRTGANIDERKNDTGLIDDFAVFGAREIKIDSQEFQGGKMTTIFGGASIDLRHANPAHNPTVLDISVLFGGTDILVPPDWTVQVDVFSLFGGFSDKRSSVLKVVPNPEKVLIIKGFVMFGGGEVKFEK